MAGECTKTTSVTTTSSLHNWWPDLHACSWSTTTNPWLSEHNNNSESSGEESVSISTSFTNASNHSGLSVESSRRVLVDNTASAHELIGETVSDNHLWNQVLL